MDFKSDNTAPVSPEILQSIVEANSGTEYSYGMDDYSKKMQQRFSEIFEKDVLVFLTNTGTASNSLALSSLVQPFETILCHQTSHINNDECGAPEFFTDGAKLVTFGGENGKIDINMLELEILSALSLRPHKQKPGCISITQATEYGTVYNIEELNKIYKVAQKYNLPIHMDGARFANGLVTLGCSPAEATWKSGVDVLSFGATKNGALLAEAVIFFNHKYAQEFDYLHKRAGQLMSKSRFFACQFLAYFDNNLWLRNALAANEAAQKLATLFRKHNIRVVYPVQANELFVLLSPQQANYLITYGCKFYAWGEPSSQLYRFVTSYCTSLQDIEALNDCLTSYYKQTIRSAL